VVLCIALLFAKGGVIVAVSCRETPVMIGPLVPGAVEHVWEEHCAASSSGAGWVVWFCKGCQTVSHAAPFAVRVAAAREAGTGQTAGCVCG
jgi:hypothetical protein